ncbi:MAG: hypothetical protein AAFQ10_14220 [Pseudomonadota bacterium]
MAHSPTMPKQNNRGVTLCALAVLMAIIAFTTHAFMSTPAKATTPGEMVEIKGEVIDTWCYYSGVMGDTDATRGTAHHTCALWCAAGGIPVGVRTDEGKVYMVLKYKGEDALAPTDTIMSVQSHIITAKGVHYQRDGVNYIVVKDVVADDGITYLSHEDYDFVPPFAQPKKPK